MNMKRKLYAAIALLASLAMLTGLAMTEAIPEEIGAELELDGAVGLDIEEDALLEGELAGEMPAALELELPMGALDLMGDATYRFIVDGETYALQNAQAGEEIIRPEDPAAPKDRVFTGWMLADGTPLFVDSDGDGQIDPVIVSDDELGTEVCVWAGFADREETRQPAEPQVAEESAEDQPTGELPAEAPAEESPIEEPVEAPTTEAPIAVEPAQELPAEEQPVEEQPADELPTEGEPSVEQPLEELPEEQPAEAPAEVQPVEKLPEEQPAGEQQVDELPAEGEPTEVQPVEEQHADQLPVEVAAEEPSVEAPAVAQTVDITVEQTVGIAVEDAVEVPAEELPVANALTYTGKPQALLSAEGAWLYSLDGDTYSEVIPVAINAGEYTVFFKAFEADAPRAITVTVTRADVVLTPPVAASSEDEK